MAHREWTEDMEAALAPLDEVSLEVGIDYERIGRIVVARLLAQRSSGQSEEGVTKVNANVQFTLSLREGTAGQLRPEICCICWPLDGYGWVCVGGCC